MRILIPHTVLYKIKATAAEKVHARTAAGKREKPTETSEKTPVPVTYSAAIPRVPNHRYDKSEENPAAKRFTDKPAKKGLECVLCTKSESACIISTAEATERAADKTRF